ncbi:MAG: hypothetical protein MZU91_12090 [Desulfosudis oleivorans]|nr:hypothetical protein [Desulfosudis oleivorans]
MRGASQIKVMAGGGAASAYDPLDVVAVHARRIEGRGRSRRRLEHLRHRARIHAAGRAAGGRSGRASASSTGSCWTRPTMTAAGREGRVAEPAGTRCGRRRPRPLRPRQRKHTVVEGTDNAFKWARKYRRQARVGHGPAVRAGADARTRPPTSSS